MRRNIIPVCLVIAFVIIGGFTMSAFFSYFSFQTLFKKDVEAVSELTSENIFVNINNLMDRPINVSLAMANDTFLRSFMLKEEERKLTPGDLELLRNYLESYQKKYCFDSVFLVSVKTGAYYHYKNGIDRYMRPGEPENEWYFKFLKEQQECSLNVDNDEAKDNIITVFVNCKLTDSEGKLLAVVGVGMETPYVQQFLVENEKKYGINAFLIDEQGNIQLSSELTEFAGVNLFKDESFRAMAAAIVRNTEAPEYKWYHSREADGYVITKYVPNLNWYLVVEKNTRDFKIKMFSQLGLEFIFTLLVVILVVTVTTVIIRRYNREVMDLAEKDLLTGVKNRTSYERETIKHSLNMAKYEHFGIGVFDLNNLKMVNDIYGHQAGDTYIKKFSAMLCGAFGGDAVFRIGGDEFAVLFININEAEVRDRWHMLLEKFKEMGRPGKPKISAAFGAAFRDAAELNTIGKIFKTADDNMYLDKERIKGKPHNETC